MNLIKYSFSFLLMITTNVYVQSQESTISFNTKFLKDQKVEFQINGQLIVPDDEKHQIKIYSTNFDTLKCRWNDNEIDVSLLKFKANTAYIITINPCSFYDIRPLNQPKKGVVRYSFLSSKEDVVIAYLDYNSKKN